MTFEFKHFTYQNEKSLQYLEWRIFPPLYYLFYLSDFDGNIQDSQTFLKGQLDKSSSNQVTLYRIKTFQKSNLKLTFCTVKTLSGCFFLSPSNNNTLY